MNFKRICVNERENVFDLSQTFGNALALFQRAFLIH